MSQANYRANIALKAVPLPSGEEQHPVLYSACSFNKEEVSNFAKYLIQVGAAVAYRIEISPNNDDKFYLDPEVVYRPKGSKPFAFLPP